MVIGSPIFDTFRQASNRAKYVKPFSGHLLVLDPGETTGYVIFSANPLSAWLIESGQFETWPFDVCVKKLSSLFDEFSNSFDHGTQRVLYESYNIYAHKLERHTHSSVPTIQIIGCIQTLCAQHGWSPITQTAQIGKSFCKDEKLRSWGFYQQGKKHARDAIRHGCNFLLFGHKE